MVMQLSEVRWRLTEKGRQALAEDKKPVEAFADETRLVYAWLQDDETAFDKVCTLKAEARADAPGLKQAPEDYLATSIMSWVEDEFDFGDDPAEDVLPYRMFRAALKRVNWGQVAEWAMRDDQRFPKVYVGDLAEEVRE
jgi:hypothetical protein